MARVVTAAGTLPIKLGYSTVGDAVTPPAPPPPPPPPPPAVPYLNLVDGLDAIVGVTSVGWQVQNTGTVAAQATVAVPGDVTCDFSPQTLSPGASVAFSLIGLVAGTKSIALTSSTAGAVITGSPTNFVVSSAPPPPPPPPPAAPGDWAQRASGPSVVWAHNFESATEVSAHLLNVDATEIAGPTTRVVDETGIGCLQQIALGGTLASSYTAGGTTMVITDATYWPDPATYGPFYFVASTAAPTVGSKNLFQCTARSGTTLTVARYTGSLGSAFSASAENYPAGSYVGNDARDWRRTFAALPATENGKAIPDAAASGAVPLRSKTIGGPLSVPRDTSLWQYGWYGHPSNQATWANWTPWEGASTLTPRGVAQGVADRYRLWDGDEFWIQFRIKLDPRFYANHAQPDPTAETNYWGRKGWAIQSEVSSLNQIVTGYGTSNRYGIPSTTANPFSLATYKASRTIGVSDQSTRTHASHQLGSPWDVAPKYADLSTSFQPSTGLPTPDGSTAWEMPDSEWVTFLLHVRPGRSNVSETVVEVDFARTEQVGYAGTYTRLLTVTDGRIVYSGTGDYEFPDGPFAYPAVTTMNALPGFQAFGLMGYFNISQTEAVPPPKASYYVRMAQVIFSRAAIPAPAAAPALPTYVPAAGEVGVLTVANGKLANTFISTCSPYYDPFFYPKITNSYGGGIKNQYWGTYGCTLHYSGGHSNTNDNSVTISEYGATQVTFRRITDPIPWHGQATDATTITNNANGDIQSKIDWIGGVVGGTMNYGEAIGLTGADAAWNGQPGASHQYGIGVVIGPEHGGATYGTYLTTAIPAVGRQNFKGTIAAHALALTSTTAASSTRFWTRHTNNRRDEAASWGAPILCTYVPAQNRVYMTRRGTGAYAPLRWYDVALGDWVEGTGSPFLFYLADSIGGDAESGCQFFVPSRNLLICCFSSGNNVAIEWMDVSVDQPTRGGRATLSTSLSTRRLPADPEFSGKSSWGAATWCPDNNRIIAAGVAQDDAAAYEIEIPAVLTDTWTVTRAPYGSGQTFFPNVATTHHKFQYDHKLKSIYWFPGSASGVADTAWIYRPRGT